MSVKSRITLAMAVVVAVNLVTAMASMTYLNRSSSYGSEATRSLAEARAVERASHNVDRFIADANALALALTADSSVELSNRTGVIFGSERSATKALRELPARVTKSDPQLGREWEDLRLATYVWINQQAQESGANLRMKRERDGGFRASVTANFLPGPGLSGLDALTLRDEVRLREERLTNGSLRRLAQDAEAGAARAQGMALSSRNTATTVSLLLICVSLVTALAAAVWLYVSIVNPLQKARRFAENVANGDLHASYDAHDRGEIGSLTRSVEDMKDAVVSRMSIMAEMAGAVIVNAEDVERFAKDALVRTRRLDDPCVVEDAEAVVHHASILTTLATQMLEV